MLLVDVAMHLFSGTAHVTRQQESCCAAALAGIGDEDYVDASFHFPIVETIPTTLVQVPLLSVPQPTLFGGVAENENLSEHYAEFNDLFNEATNVSFIVSALFRPFTNRFKICCSKKRK
ncbi:unnamed protein product [Hydatigera taeniaeformis]|uniref:Secreted protein n=1 Tax=Hydatigena taeniaeformis TaxID=6205 RepID=A0A0R3WXT5_HYDTA|nr:unnamed protein product [Hydatigera taeniaeformis]